MVLFLDWLMSMEPAPLSNHPESPAQAIPGGLASHHPEAATRANPVMSETQQVESTWWYSFPDFPTVGLVRWTTKRDQPCLVGMQGQAVLAKTFGQHLQNPPGIFLTGEVFLYCLDSMLS